MQIPSISSKFLILLFWETDVLSRVGTENTGPGLTAKSDHSCKVLSLEGKVPDQRKGGEFDFASKDTDSPVCSRARRPAGGLGGIREEAGRCSTFLELSELNGVRNSALCAARRRLLFEPAAWRGRSGARHCSQPTHPGVSPAAGDRQREERTTDPAGRPSDRQSALLWKRGMARRGHQRNKGPEGEKSLHEVQVKTEGTV